MKISKQVKVAILVISGIALFIYLFTFLKGENLFTSKNIYYSVFDYNAISISSSVNIKGNRVGKIEAISYDFDTDKTLVKFSVDPRLKFSKNSTIKLYETSLMDGNALTIINTKDDNFAKPGDTLPSYIQPGLISSLRENFTGLSLDLDHTIRSADTLMTNLNAIIVDDSKDGIRATISELNQTLKSFKYTSESVQQLIKANNNKISELFNSLGVTGKNLEILTTNLKDVEFARTIANLNTTIKSLKKVLTNIENGEGTIGKLLRNDKLYNNIEAASKEMHLLLLDIKLNPARYRRILSKKEIPYTSPTKDQMN